MRYYEAVYIAHPSIEQEDLPKLIEETKTILAKRGGELLYEEVMGKKSLAYPIQKIHKAHYVLMNIECNQEALDELTSAFRFNDAILRNMVLKMDGPVTETSLLAKSDERDDRAPAAADDSEEVAEEAAEEAE